MSSAWGRHRRGAHGFRRDERGVSSIIGGLLFLSILIVSFVNLRVAVVPMLDEEREARHMALVGDRFAALKADIDRQLGDHARASVSTVVPMQSLKGAGFFTDGRVASFLSFDATTRNVTLEAKELLVQTDNGTTVFGADETWTNITSGETVEEIMEVKHLRVRLQDPQAEAAGDNIVVTVTDASGTFAGDLKVYIKKHPSGYSVDVRVRSADLDTLYDQGSSYFNQDQPPFYWVDALADEVQFADVLGRAAAPFSLTFTKSGMDGAFTVVYYEDTPVGPILVGPAGQLYPDWNRTEAGGVLRYEGPNVHFIRQDLYLESGAIIVDQPVGNAFFVEPSLDLQSSATRTIVRITAPALIGREEMQSGPDGIPVRVQGVSRAVTLGTAPHLGFNVSTAHPDVWRAFWTWKFEGAGFSEAAGHFTLASGPDWARFDFYGLVPDPASTEHDLALELHTGNVAVVLRG